MSWRSECPTCGGLQGGCRCPDDTPQPFDGTSLASVRRARRDFERRVEQAIESGDDSELHARLDRHVEKVSR